MTFTLRLNFLGANILIGLAERTLLFEQSRQTWASTICKSSGRTDGGHRRINPNDASCKFAGSLSPRRVGFRAEFVGTPICSDIGVSLRYATPKWLTRSRSYPARFPILKIMDVFFSRDFA